VGAEVTGVLTHCDWPVTCVCASDAQRHWSISERHLRRRVTHNGLRSSGGAVQPRPVGRTPRSAMPATPARTQPPAPPVQLVGRRSGGAACSSDWPRRARPGSRPGDRTGVAELPAGHDRPGARAPRQPRRSGPDGGWAGLVSRSVPAGHRGGGHRRRHRGHPCRRAVPDRPRRRLRLRGGRPRQGPVRHPAALRRAPRTGRRGTSGTRASSRWTWRVAGPRCGTSTWRRHTGCAGRSSSAPRTGSATGS
jgi:hypothetical protein